MKREIEYDELLTPAEVAKLFRVAPTQVNRWARAGKFPEGSTVKTIGGHRRFKAKAIRALLGMPADGERSVCICCISPIPLGTHLPGCPRGTGDQR